MRKRRIGTAIGGRHFGAWWKCCENDRKSLTQRTQRKSTAVTAKRVWDGNEEKSEGWKEESNEENKEQQVGCEKSSGRGSGDRSEARRGDFGKLDEAYPEASCELKHENAFQLLISTILSAQCTDVRVNQVTQDVVQEIHERRKILRMQSPAELEKEIRPTGFFRNKTKSIMGASKAIVEKFGGQVPRTMEEILTLPGVARKTGNVVLGWLTESPSGVVVDTHVIRLSHRLDLTTQP